MSGVATAVAGATLVGGYLSSQASKDAAQTSANAQIQSGQQAADAAKFRPVGITSNFGSSNFTTDPNTGYLTGAGYTLNPTLQNLQNGLFGTIGGYNPSGYQSASQDLFNLGKSYLATSPQDAATQYYNQQRQLLAPGRERDLATIQNQQFQTGRSGLGVGGTRAGYTAGGPGLMQANPQLAAYYNSIAGADADLAAKSDAYGMARNDYGLKLMGAAPGLFTAGYAPYQSLLGLSSSIEQMGQSPLDIGAQLGGRSATAGQNVGSSLLSSGTSAAKTLQNANQYSVPGAFLQGASNSVPLNNWFNSMIGNNNSSFGNSGMSSGMTQGMAPGVAAPAAATWENAFASGWDR